MTFPNTLKPLSNFESVYFFDIHEAGVAVDRLPLTLRLLLENLLRNADTNPDAESQLKAIGEWQPEKIPDQEVAFFPARVVMQDFTGVPAIVDLAAMRDAMTALGGNPDKINPVIPVELVCDHSVQVDVYADPNAVEKNASMEYQRNRERYSFLHWGQSTFDNFRVVPPATGIVHQVNLEYLARVVCADERDGRTILFPDTLVGTDSHTTMINALCVLGWGVGGIEAETAMLGQAVPLLCPQIVNFRLYGQLNDRATATDLVLTLTEILRAAGVVGQFIEFSGEGLDALSVADRATIANMSPEFGATCSLFPIDNATIHYLRQTGREESQLALIAAYAKAQGLWRDPQAEQHMQFSRTLELNLAEVEPCIAGPKRPQDRIPLTQSKRHIDSILGEADKRASADTDNFGELRDGSVVLAAITSCTNTSNPDVIIAAALLAKAAHERGLTVPNYVKTSFAPGSKVVGSYLRKSGLMSALEALGFHEVAFGCTTCIGNSGPLMTEISKAIQDQQLQVCSVLSGNRNFEGRIHPDIRLNFLASPPLVVAYALAGRVDIDLNNDALGTDSDGNNVYLTELWPTKADIHTHREHALARDDFMRIYANVFDGDPQWQNIHSDASARYRWDDESTYIRNPPYFVDLPREPEPLRPIENARCLALLGDSVTTDHISPAGAIKKDSPAGQYLQEHGVAPEDFNSYGSRRGNHEVMIRGTFANIRIRNRLAPDTEGGWSRFLPENKIMSIYDAAQRYAGMHTPLVIIAGKEYGTGSSRDWAAKGTALLGIKAVLAESFERIHRSNLIGMGVLPLQFKSGTSAQLLGLDGEEHFNIEALEVGAKTVEVQATKLDGTRHTFIMELRIDTPREWDYFQHGGILAYALRHLHAGA